MFGSSTFSDFDSWCWGKLSFSGCDHVVTKWSMAYAGYWTLMARLSSSQLLDLAVPAKWPSTVLWEWHKSDSSNENMAQAHEVHHSVQFPIDFYPTWQSLLLEAVAGMFCGSWQNVCACQSAGKTLFCEMSHEHPEHSVLKQQTLHKSNECSKETYIYIYKSLYIITKNTCNIMQHMVATKPGQQRNTHQPLRVHTWFKRQATAARPGGTLSCCNLQGLFWTHPFPRHPCMV